MRLPKEFRFDTKEVYIRKEGNNVILSPRPTDWGSYFEEGPVASPEFMENVEDLPLQERELWSAADDAESEQVEERRDREGSE